MARTHVLAAALLAPAVFACICVLPPAEPPSGPLPPTAPPSAPSPDPEEPDDPAARCLAELNETCAARWCKGPIEYRFDELTCGGARCTVHFKFRGGAGKRGEDSCEIRASDPAAVCDDWGLDQLGTCLERQ